MLGRITYICRRVIEQPRRGGRGTVVCGWELYVFVCTYCVLSRLVVFDYTSVFSSLLQWLLQPTLNYVCRVDITTATRVGIREIMCIVQ